MASADELGTLPPPISPIVVQGTEEPGNVHVSVADFQEFLFTLLFMLCAMSRLFILLGGCSYQSNGRSIAFQ